MATTLANLQIDARFHANDSELDLTGAAALRIVNLVYQSLCTPGGTLGGRRIGRRWPELIRQNTSLTTTAGTETYTFPTSPVFKSGEWTLELLRAAQSSEPYFIDEATDEGEWSALDWATNAIPERYRLLHNGTAVVLALRPKPDTTGDTLRITGLIEATDMTASNNTVFREAQHDRALAILIAAEWKRMRLEPDRASELMFQALSLLPRNRVGIDRPQPTLQAWAT